MYYTVKYIQLLSYNDILVLMINLGGGGGGGGGGGVIHRCGLYTDFKNIFT